MREIRWLHFSDLHLNQSGVETRRLRKKLPEHLKSLGIRFDYAFCTGDLRFAPAGIFPEDTATQIREICDAAGVPLSRLFVVPGNHDIDRSAPGRVEAVRRVHYGEQGSYSPAVGSIASDNLACIAEGRAVFAEIMKTLYADVPGRAELYSNAQQPHFLLSTDDLNVLHLDSTLVYCQEQQNDLVVGTELLLNMLEQTDRAKPSVLLTHYSFDYLNRNEQKQVLTLLQDFNVQLWLAGHEHDQLCRWQWDQFYEFQCGNLVLENGAKSCILLGRLDLDTGAGDVKVHAWFPQGGWAEYPFVRTNVSNASVYPFQLMAAGRPVAEEHTKQKNALAACRNYESAGGPFFNLNIHSELVPDLQWGQRLFRNQPKHCSLLDAVDTLWRQKKSTGESCHALLLGDGGMGKSTTLFLSCKRLLEERRIPAVFASLHLLQSTATGLENHLLRSLYSAESEQSRNQLLQLLQTEGELPSVVLLVDGFNELRSETANRYAADLKRLSQYPGIQIVVSSRLDFLRRYGMTHFQMLQACPLRDDQISTLFSDQEWQNILSKQHLHILLQNPMMALLYVQTCPLIEKYRDLEFCDWKLPILNAADLLYDYYLSQVVLLLDRTEVSGQNIYFSYYAVRYLLPCLAFRAEQEHMNGWTDEAFSTHMVEAIQEITALHSHGLPAPLVRIMRIYQLTGDDAPSANKLDSLLLSELCLLRAGGRTVAFPHQIFRDYLSAVYLYDKLTESEEIPAIWKETPIHAGVMEYLRHMHSELWGEEGMMAHLLAPYRGKEREAGDYFVQNAVDCWLPEDAETDVERDLSRLDFRDISLAEHFKRHYSGSILLDGAMVSRKTFVNEKRHDRIIGLAFSHDGRMLAAVSANGIVTVCNVLTQSQMIVGEFKLSKNTALGYTTGDCLLLRTEGNAWIWPTITYDKVENAAASDSIFSLPWDEKKSTAGQLCRMLEDSGRLGSVYTVSDDGTLLAVGNANGLLQIWDSEEQECIAELSMGDRQIVSASFSWGGEVAALCAGGSLVQLWNVEQKRCIGVMHFDRPIRRVRFQNQLEAGMPVFLNCECSDGRCFQWNIQTNKIEEYRNSRKLLRKEKKLRGKLKGKAIQKIEMADNGNALILLKNSPDLLVWNEATNALNICSGHGSPILDAALCKADSRFAASYSGERFHGSKGDRKFEGQKLVRVWALRVGNCMQRLPTEQRTIKRLQFFTANRIILAGFATNHDILLWELHNRLVHGEERGHWDMIDIVRDGPDEPLECAVSPEAKLFIGVYADGTLFSRTFSGSQHTSFQVFPGIDLSAVKWNDLICGDRLKEMLQLHRG